MNDLELGPDSIDFDSLYPVIPFHSSDAWALWTGSLADWFRCSASSFVHGRAAA